VSSFEEKLENPDCHIAPKSGGEEEDAPFDVSRGIFLIEAVTSIMKTTLLLHQVKQQMENTGTLIVQ